MKVLNIIWAFSTGGIGKLFLQYAALGEYDATLDITSVCIDLQNCDYDRVPLEKAGVLIVPIKNRKDFSWIKGLNRIAKDVSPDIIFCHGFNGPVVVKVCALFEKSFRVPMICTYHGLYNPPTRSKVLVSSITNKVQAWMYKKFAHSIILVSKYSGQYLLEQGVSNEKMKVVYNGISPKISPIKPVDLKYGGISIGVVGRLDAIKGLKYLVDAVAKVKQQIGEEFHVYIVGDGPEEESLKDQVKEMKLEKNISFVGYQNNIPAWLKAWDIFCLPSLQENHSIALLEAMRSGKAIVCTAVGGNPETVTDGKEALMVPSCDSDALAVALLRFINSEDLRTKLGRNAYIRFQEHFTENAMKRELCGILKNAKL